MCILGKYSSLLVCLLNIGPQILVFRTRNVAIRNIVSDGIYNFDKYITLRKSCNLHSLCFFKEVVGS